VEVPSQILESWARDKGVLDTFAIDYRDPSRHLPEPVIEKLESARRASIATHYRRQLTFAILDLVLHGPPPEEGERDVVEVSNALFTEIFLPVPADTAFVAYFGHLTGYDGGYYGYAWADAIAADLVTVFTAQPGGFMDPTLGTRLRAEIFAPGGSRDPEVSIHAFLGRKRSLEPFLVYLGVPVR
jgi:Zn-dependent oligopeptidase